MSQDLPIRQPRTPLRALIVCTDEAVRAELGALLAALEINSTPVAAGNGLAGARLSAIDRPHVVVLDVADAGGADDVLGITAASPSSALIVFTALSDRRSSARLRTAGAVAVVSKSDSTVLRELLSELAGPGGVSRATSARVGAYFLTSVMGRVDHVVES